MTFDPAEHTSIAMHIASGYDEHGVTLKQISGQLHKLTSAQVSQVLDLLVKRGYGVYRSKYHPQQKKTVRYFFGSGWTVPWSGEVITCQPEVDYSVPEAQPTTIPAGSKERIDLMQRRYLSGLPLWIEGDDSYRHDRTCDFWD